jgi:hypothetical protein
MIEEIAHHRQRRPDLFPQFIDGGERFRRAGAFDAHPQSDIGIAAGEVDRGRHNFMHGVESKVRHHADDLDRRAGLFVH